MKIPGIYLNRKLEQRGFSEGTSDWGGRFKSEMDKRDRIWVRISRERKISVLILLIAKGLSKNDILELLVAFIVVKFEISNFW